MTWRATQRSGRRHILAAAGFSTSRAVQRRQLQDDLRRRKPEVLDVQIDGKMPVSVNTAGLAVEADGKVVASAMAWNVGNECAHC